MGRVESVLVLRLEGGRRGGAALSFCGVGVWFDGKVDRWLKLGVNVRLCIVFKFINDELLSRSRLRASRLAWMSRESDADWPLD
jgi:hypothetical protein